MTKLPITINGLEIAESINSGGKSGKGRAKTRTIQVRAHPCASGYLIKKSFSYPRDDAEKREAAIEKAREWVASQKS